MSSTEMNLSELNPVIEQVRGIFEPRGIENLEQTLKAEIVESPSKWRGFAVSPDITKFFLDALTAFELDENQRTYREALIVGIVAARYSQYKHLTASMHRFLKAVKRTSNEASLRDLRAELDRKVHLYRRFEGEKGMRLFLTSEEEIAQAANLLSAFEEEAGKIVSKYDTIVRERQDAERRKYKEERARITASLRRDLAPHLNPAVEVSHSDM